ACSLGLVAKQGGLNIFRELAIVLHTDWAFPEHFVIMFVKSSCVPTCFPASRRGLLVRASAMPIPPRGPREPSRPVALPSGTLWLLDAMQDQYYNVRGAAFVIPRVEERESAQESTIARRAKFVRSKSLPARRPIPSPEPASFSLIHQAVAQQPTALTLISDGPLVDVEPEVVDGDGGLELPASSPAATGLPTSSCTGIVHVPTASVDADLDVDGDVFRTSSTSPRRTKMLRFTCLANGCRAVNVKPISPESFSRGTVFAQCARCAKWHLIRDHLNLWDQSRRTVYRNGKRVAPPPSPPPLTLEEVPEALRPALEDLDFFRNGGRVSGWEQQQRRQE
ncbi:hypothetical protein Vafri_9093, partial [Volvox africanus]